MFGQDLWLTLRVSKISTDSTTPIGTCLNPSDSSRGLIETKQDCVCLHVLQIVSNLVNRISNSNKNTEILLNKISKKNLEHRIGQNFFVFLFISLPKVVISAPCKLREFWPPHGAPGWKHQQDWKITGKPDKSRWNIKYFQILSNIFKYQIFPTFKYQIFPDLPRYSQVPLHFSTRQRWSKMVPFCSEKFSRRSRLTWDRSCPGSCFLKRARPGGPAARHGHTFTAEWSSMEQNPFYPF